MVLRNRLWLLLLAGIAIVAIILLSSTVRQLELAPGFLALHRETEETLPEDEVAQPGSQGPVNETLFAVFRILVLIAVPASFVYVIISPDARKRVLRGIALLMWLLAAFVIMRNRPDVLQNLQPQAQQPALLDDGSMPTVKFDATPPKWLISVATLALAGLLAMGMVGIAWIVWRRNQRPPPTLEAIAREAQTAINDIRSGADLHDTVTRCYLSMVRVLEEERGFEREATMTPREFESQLQSSGLPQEEVRRLTRLFESVRYGSKAPGEREAREAVSALEAIADACRGPA